MTVPCIAQLKTVVQFGHDLPVSELTYSPDGKILASTDGINIKLWDISTGMEFKTLYAGEGKMYRIAHLQFVKGVNPYVLSYLYNGKIIYQDALSDELLDGSIIKKKLKDTLSIEDKLDMKYPDRDNDSLQLKKYFSALSSYNEKGAEQWKELDKKTGYACITHNTEGNVRVTRRSSNFDKKQADDLKEVSDKAVKRNESIAKSNKKKARKGLPQDEFVVVPYAPRAGEKMTMVEVFETTGTEPQLTINIDRTFCPVEDLDSWDLHVSADGRFVVVADHIYNIDVNSKTKGAEIARLQVDSIQSWSWAEISNDNNYIITGRKDTSMKTPNLYIWNSKNVMAENTSKKKKKKTDVIKIESLPILHKIYCEPVKKILLLPDAGYCLTLHANNRLRYWNIATGIEDSLFFKRFNSSSSLNNMDNMNALAVNSQSRTVVTGSYSKATASTALHVWDIKTGTLAKQLGAKIAPVKVSAVQLQNDTLLIKEWEHASFLEAKSFIHISSQQERAIGLRQMNMRNGEVQNRAVDDNFLFSPNWQLYIYSKDTLADKQVYFLNSKQQVLLPESRQYNEFAFDNVNKYVAGVKGDTVQVWLLQTGSVHVKRGYSNTVSGIAMDDAGSKLITLLDSNYAEILDLSTFAKTAIHTPEKKGLLKKVLKGMQIAEKAQEYSGGIQEKMDNPDNIQTWTSGTDDDVENDDAVRASDLISALGKDGKYKVSYFEKATWSHDGSQLFLWRGNGFEMYHYNFNLPQFKIDEPKIFRYGYSFGKLQGFHKLIYNAIPDDPNSLMDDYAREFIRYKIETDRISKFSSINAKSTYFAVNNRPYSGKRNIDVTDLTTQKSFDKKDKSVPIGRPYLSPSGKYFAASSQGDKFQVIRLWDVQNEALIKTFVGHSGELSFSDDETKLISSGTDRQIKVWDIESPGSMVSKPLFSFVAIKGTDEYIIYTPDGYYMSTRGNTNAIAFRFKDKSYPFEQFDAKFNRPDLVVKTLSSLASVVDTTALNMYYQAYLNRIEKLKLDRQLVEMAEYTPPPTAVFVNKETMPVAIDKDEYSFEVQLEAGSNYELKQLDVFVNGVSIYGSEGKKINGSAMKVPVKIKLSKGLNKIQLKSTDSRGEQSLYDTHEIYCNATQDPKLYVINIGLSQYKINSLNLETIAKDMAEWSKHFNPGDKVKIINLYNENASYQAILNLKNQLMQTHEEDEVIIYYAGHCVGNGISLTTYDYGSNGSKGEIAITELESLLDGIPARKKLLMINACKAGDKQTGPVYRAMRQLFVNLNRDNGSSVIVAAEGDEYAKMTNSQKNGHSQFGWLLCKALNERVNALSVYSLSRILEQGFTDTQHPYAKSINTDSNFIILQ